MSLVTETFAKLPARNSRIETFTVIQHRTDNCSFSIYSRCVSFVELARTLQRSNSTRRTGFEQLGIKRLVTSFFSSRDDIFAPFIESEYRCFVWILLIRFIYNFYKFFHHDSSPWSIFDIDIDGFLEDVFFRNFQERTKVRKFSRFFVLDSILIKISSFTKIYFFLQIFDEGKEISLERKTKDYDFSSNW